MIQFRYLNHTSRIVQTSALQALYELAEGQVHLIPRVVQVLEQKAQTGSHAVANRAPKPLAGLESRETMA